MVNLYLQNNNIGNKSCQMMVFCEYTKYVKSNIQKVKVNLKLLNTYDINLNFYKNV